MSKLLKHDWSDTSIKWLETDHIQTAVCQSLKRHKDYKVKFDFAARFNEGERSPRMGRLMKLAGLTSGEPDLDIWLLQSKCVHIELKGKKTPISKNQTMRHKELRNLGHDVYIVRADCPQSGVDQVLEILNRHLL